jgi:glutaredoxin
MYYRGNIFMSNNSQIIVYTLETCPNCEILKDFLTKWGAAYEIRDMMSPAALTELRINGVFVREAPVLQRDRTFLTSADLFSATGLQKDVVTAILEGE